MGSSEQLEQARRNLPLRRLMEQHGHSPSNGKWKDMQCPFCGKKGGAGLFTRDGQEFFKCFHTSCSAGDKAMDEIGYLAAVGNLSRQDAFVAYLKQAGVWKEDRLSPSVLPGQRPRRKALPTLPPETPTPEHDGNGASMVDRAAKLVRERQSASLRMLQAELNIGPKRAMALLQELEQRGVVGPVKPGGSREVLNLPDGNQAEIVAASTAPASPAQPPSTPTPPSGGGSNGNASEETRSPGRGDLHAANDASSFETEVQAELAALQEEEDQPTPTPAEPVVKESLTADGDEAPPAELVDAAAEAAEAPPVTEVPDAENAEVKAPEQDAEEALHTKGLACLRRFYEQLTLSPEDQERLWRDRGLLPETCQRAGLRSNPKSNFDLLMKLQEEFATDVLLESGLFTEVKRGGVEPNVQFYGFGMAGKDVWDWTHPVLIPYFDNAGRVMRLRPHKGGASGKVSMPYTVGHSSKGVLITEGEFKALAVWQATGGAVACAALPGITMAKNFVVMDQLQDWLKANQTDRIAVVYDNEEKGDPALPGFKADTRKRFDSVIWARFLAIVLERDGYDARVGNLPNGWRNAKGKADWDGALAMLTESAAVASAEAPARWAERKVAVRKAFLEVMRDANGTGSFKQPGLFDSEAERVIGNGITRLFYKAELPHGGDRERKVADKLSKLAKGPLSDIPGVKQLAQMYRQVLDWYYILKPWSEPKQTALSLAMKKAREEKDYDHMYYLNLAMEGRPDRVADFRMEGLYTLQRLDGKMDRLVQLRNAQGEVKEMASLPSMVFAAPTKFREWLMDQGNYTWMTGERPLQQLQRDINFEVSYRNVHQVPAYGDDAASRLWFFEDGAWADGVPVAQESGIYWHDGVGYWIGDRGGEGQMFRHAKPRMHPTQRLIRHADGRYELVEGSFRDSRSAAVSLFQDLGEAMKATVGGHAGWMLVGGMLAYLAAPEIFSTFGAFPGAFVHGEAESGKTTLVSWLMELWGYHNMSSGIGLLRNSSAVGLQIAAEQFSNVPVWLDEFRFGEVAEDKISILKSAFNREIQAKYSQDGRTRKMRTTYIVSGESTMGDAAARSRYTHVQVSKAARQHSTWDWFQEHRPFLFAITRELLVVRAEFAKRVKEELQAWIASPDLKGINDRTRLVHGVSWAAFSVAEQMFESHGPKLMAQFREFLIKECQVSMTAVAGKVNVNRFWEDVITAVKSDAFGHTRLELERVFKVKMEPVDHPPGQPNQTSGAWRSYTLYVEPNMLIGELARHLRSQGRELPLERGDIQSQMAARPYFIKGKHRQRFGAATSACWAIAVDKHELGYQPTSDEELEASRKTPNNEWVPTSDWADPRQGPLWAIISRLMKED